MSDGNSIFPSEKKILLTGATGFVGRHFVQRYPVSRCVVRTREQSPCLDNFQINSLSGLTIWDGAFNGIDTVIHLAGLAHASTYTQEDYQRVNVDGTLALAQQAAKAGVQRFVFVSSIGVNGQRTDLTAFSINSKPSPHNQYAQSKYDAELKLVELGMHAGIEIVIVRPTLVYGPCAPGNFGLLAKLVSKLPILPFGRVCNRRHFISVQNLCHLLMTCACAPKAAGQIFLASEGEAVSTREFTNAIARGLGKRVWQIPIPLSIMKFGAKLIGKPALAEQLLGNLEVDSSNLYDVLRWRAPYTMAQAMSFLSEQPEVSDVSHD
ncbi:N-acetyl-alpha-D-glucosaminyl-diphospho-ditrans, octacis-undecaprenol 4-epimerase [Vibrio stylophorae]|uniref:N-acetyl-alpha-D-glucosaminyl-diphospho-ditrans, octacis-undecaprenol 4-epimerase n=1 Tax=Vibrio stylophorae TaxID=659351 RepID=A0ABM8ZWH8_9VIBR|nr:NAD-dependent epimerase/dehydratase family protein [Vibrio stylophorae]CAH0534701.1 N-acetyl-alpha-D-glucosaminyl-diphospho-ditrans, octacis-undecaprenol 4-epimerase [Vibrio stylophorae]